ncbi:hypothetical protein CF328_g8759 [Tilletia controversa]|nr:hypothetical protein CF328_g8759 [Tilletia controversa]
MHAELRLSSTGSGESFAPKTFIFDRPSTLELDGHVPGLNFLPAPAADNAILPSFALVIDQAFIRYDGSSFTLKSVPWHSDSVCIDGRLLGDRVHALSDGDKLRFGKYFKDGLRFETECAVRVRISFPPPAPTTTNLPGVRKLLKDLREDKAQDRPSRQSASRDKAGTLSASRVPTSVPTSVLQSPASPTTPVPVSDSLLPSHTSIPGISTSSSSAIDHTTSSATECRPVVSRSYAELIAQHSHAYDPPPACLASATAATPKFSSPPCIISTTHSSTVLGLPPPDCASSGEVIDPLRPRTKADHEGILQDATQLASAETVSGSLVSSTSVSTSVLAPSSPHSTAPSPSAAPGNHGSENAKPSSSQVTSAPTLSSPAPTSEAPTRTCHSEARLGSVDCALARIRSAWLLLRQEVMDAASAALTATQVPSHPPVHVAAPTAISSPYRPSSPNHALARVAEAWRIARQWIHEDSAPPTTASVSSRCSVGLRSSPAT